MAKTRVTVTKGQAAAAEGAVLAAARAADEARAIAMLPPLLREVAGLAGLEVALLLGRELGGQRHYLRQVPGRDDPVARVAGLRVARLLAAAPAVARHFLPDTRLLKWPVGKDARIWRDARRLRRELGWTVQEIAAELDISVRQAERHCGGIEPLVPHRTRRPVRPPGICPVCGRGHRPPQPAPGRQLALPLPSPAGTDDATAS